MFILDSLGVRRLTSALFFFAAGCLDEARSAPEAQLTTIAERVPFAFGAVIPQLPPLEIGEGAVEVRAEQCGACHVDNYREWKQSTHAHAMRDPQFFAELSKPSSPRWLCINCHAPIQNQRRVLVSETSQLVDDPHDLSDLIEVPNAGFDAAMQREGVTCAACHVRLEEGRSVVIASAKSGRAPHPVRARPKALRSVCQRCHDPGPGAITPVFTCWFETARELRASGVEQDCVDCHMSRAQRPVVPEGRPRSNRHHYWAGGGVPKTYSAYDDLLARDYTPGIELQTKLRGALVEVSIVNAHAGHHVTSADPERHLMVRVRAQRGGAPMRTVAVRRLGQTWDWGALEPLRPARKTGDTRIPHGKRARWTVKLPSEWRAVEVDVAHVRVTPSNARHMKKANIPRELARIWPQAPSAVARLESVYPLMTWVARRRLVRGEAEWKETALPDLLEASKALRNATLEDHEALFATE